MYMFSTKCPSTIDFMSIPESSAICLDFDVCPMLESAEEPTPCAKTVGFLEQPAARVNKNTANAAQPFISPPLILPVRDKFPVQVRAGSVFARVPDISKLISRRQREAK